jgi:hypothetical protein
MEFGGERQPGRSSDKTGLMFSQNRRLAARSNIISLIKTPRRLFIFSDCHGPAVTSSSHHAYGLSLAYGSCLMANVRRCSCHDAAFLVTLKSKPVLWSRQFSLTAIEARSATSRERKIKSRTEIRRADKIELKNVISSRRKSFVFRIMEIKNIYRFSRES